jgi:coenzyme F420-reducing hydrogenase delta subunit
MSDTPVVDVAAKTVIHAGHTFILRALTEDSFTVLVSGIPVGRAVYSFGANAVLESPELTKEELEAHGVTEIPKVTQEALDAVSEAWFAAL